jgi:hypothetical protein
MNINEFKQLSENEANQLLKAPALITVLISTADGKIEAEETEWATKVVGYRDHVGDEDLFSYYTALEDDFSAKVKALVEEDHIGNQERIASLSRELEQLGPILGKINKHYADKLVVSWKSFAKSVAKSSGGLLGFGSISDQEEMLMDLHMIKY